MKLKNILLMGLAVLLGTACSKDDLHSRIEDAADATIKVAVKSAGLATTKAADLNELPGEANINNLTVLVFDETGTALLGEPTWALATSQDGVATILNVPCKSLKAQIVIVSNTPQGTFGDVTNITDFQSRLVQLSTQSQTALTMSSRVIATEHALLKDDNYLGYTSMGAENINGIDKPVELTRLVARVELTDVVTRFAGTKLAGRTLQIDEAYVANQKTASHYFSTTYWGAVEAAGHLANSSPMAIGQTVTDNASLTTSSYVHYIMENESASEAATQLVIKATLLATTGYAAETKLFAATINENGIAKGYNHNYVKRNFVYRLHLTFTEKSFSGEPTPPEPPIPPIPPATGDLEVQVEVLNWGPISQDVVVE